MVSLDFRSRYLNSVLGATWSILNPLAQILIYTLIFSKVMQARLPGIDDALGYSIYVCAGILPWQYFTEVLTRNQTVFLDNANILKKVKFPRTSLPLYVFLSASISYLFLLVIFLFFLLLAGRLPGLPLLGLFVLLILQQGMALGLGVFLGTIHVFFRDTGYILGIVLQFWFWLTPIVYPLAIVPDRFHWLLNINPMTGIIQGYHNIFLYGQWPDPVKLIPAALLVVFFLLAGYLTFNKLNKEMVDEL